jgi:hypothetical protein
VLGVSVGLETLRPGEDGRVGKTGKGQCFVDLHQTNSPRFSLLTALGEKLQKCTKRKRTLKSLDCPSVTPKN